MTLPHSPTLSSTLDLRLRDLTHKIRQSLDLPEILSTTVKEVQDWLQTDRIKIYQFASDGHGEVVAESLLGDNLPSLLGLHFPADDIPESIRKLYVELGIRSVTNVTNGSIGLIDQESIEYHDLDPCHQEYLKAMGVESSIVLPILLRSLSGLEISNSLWGLLISHHRQSHIVTPEELDGLQWVTEQLSMAISESLLFEQIRQQAQQSATLNHINSLLHSLPSIELQPALQETVNALRGCAGRLYLLSTEDQPSEIYNYSTLTQSIDFTIIPEEHRVWHKFVDNATPEELAITDLYKIPDFRIFVSAFNQTSIRGWLILPLRYRQNLLGYLSVFRSAISTEKIWAGEFDPSQLQSFPRQSFTAWKEIKQGQCQEWTKQDLKLAESLNQVFSSAIEQYQLYQHIHHLNNTLEQQVEQRTAQLQKSLESQSVLKRITDQIRSSLDLEKTLNTLVQEIRELLNCDRVIIYKFSQDWGGSVIIENIGPSVSSILGVVGPQECFATRYAEYYIRRRVRAINDVANANLTPCHQEFLEQLSVKANLVVPICIGQKLWGLMVAHQCQNTRTWQKEEIDLLQQVADQTAVMINQVELYQQSCQSAKIAIEKADQLEQLIDQQRATFRVICKIRETLELETLFNSTATEVRRLLNVDRVGIYQFAENSNYHQGVFIAEDRKPEISSILNRFISEENCFDGRVDSYTKGKIQAITDLENSTLNPCYKKLLASLEVKSNLIVPLLKQEELWGLLCLHHCTKTHEWQPSEISFIQQIATHLGVALTQANLFQTTQDQNQKILKTLEDLRKAQTQLIQSEKMSSLGQLVAGVAHEINNPVNFIYGNLSHLNNYIQDIFTLIETYQKKYPIPEEEIAELIEDIDLDFILEDLPKAVTSLQVGAERIRQLVLSLRNFSHLDQAEKKPVDIHEGIDSTLLILQHRLKEKVDQKGITVVKNYSTIPLVECYAGQLNQVFMNLLSNAIDAIFDKMSEVMISKTVYHPQITITTSLEEESKQVKIIIEDNAMGMKEDVVKSIFDPFFTTKEIGKGTGLGLAISYQIIVEKHGGSIDCQSTYGQGTQFKIMIPC